MTDEHIAAVRMVRDEADRLRATCVALASTASLLHIAYDRTISKDLPATFMGLLKAADTKRS